ncbi:ABC transporter permease [bacterium]|nr:ABC transporter permease [bacterium]
MKFILRLSIKNLFRYYKRTLITSFSIALGIAIFIWADGMLSWAEDMSERNLKNYETSYLKIGDESFFEEEEYLPLDKTINEREEVENFLKTQNMDYTPEVKFAANLINDFSGESYPFVGYGIDPASHPNIYKTREAVYQGGFITEGNQILISKYTSELLTAEIDDYLIIEADTKYDLHNADAFKVIGIYETPNPEVNMNIFYIPIETTNDFLEMENEINLIAIKVDVTDEKLSPYADSLERELRAAGFSHLVVQTWEDMAQTFIAIKEGKRGGNGVMLFLIFIIVTIGVANTMMMAVFERTGEIGMMRAMGMTKREIMYCFMFESAGVGFIGGLLGIAIGSAFLWYLVVHGLDYTSMIGGMSYGYRTSAIIHAQWNPGMMIIGWIFAIVSSIIVSIIPARKALKMGIAEILSKIGKFG